jgi:hypothetical protein
MHFRPGADPLAALLSNEPGADFREPAFAGRALLITTRRGTDEPEALSTSTEKGRIIMKPSLARFSCTVAIGALALAVNAQTPAQPATSQPQIPSPLSATPTDEQFSTRPVPAPEAEQNFPMPAKPPSGDSPQLTTNAQAQALAEYDAAQAFCKRQSDDRRDACLKDTEDGYHRALRGDTPGMQGNPGSIVGERSTPR